MRRTTVVRRPSFPHAVGRPCRDELDAAIIIEALENDFFRFYRLGQAATV